MIEKNNDYDETYPDILYRGPKYVKRSEAFRQISLEYMSHNLYRECVSEDRHDQ
jgi:hypothetical protein